MGKSRTFDRFFFALRTALILADLSEEKRRRCTPVAEEYDLHLEPVPADEAQLPAHMVRTRAAERAATPYWNRD